jgi:hypothetical protein
VDVVALWLDGAVVDVDLAALPGAGPSSELSDDAVAGPGAELEAELDVGVDMVRLLPTNDLAWIDRLDDDALERAETWLAGKG